MIRIYSNSRCRRSILSILQPVRHDRKELLIALLLGLNVTYFVHCCNDGLAG